MYCPVCTDLPLVIQGCAGGRYGEGGVGARTGVGVSWLRIDGRGGIDGQNGRIGIQAGRAAACAILHGTCCRSWKP